MHELVHRKQERHQCDKPRASSLPAHILHALRHDIVFLSNQVFVKQSGVHQWWFRKRNICARLERVSKPTLH